MAALIKAMDDGIERKLDPGEPEERNIYEAMEAGKAKRVPMTGEALEALEADDVVKKRAARRDVPSSCTTSGTSGRAHCATVTDWDVQEYSTFCRRRPSAHVGSQGSSTGTARSTPSATR